MKKIITAFLALFLIFSVVACTNDSDRSDFQYEQTDDGIIITGSSVLARELVIPKELDGQPIIAIADSAFYKNERLRKVTFPSSLEIIGAYAFADCPNLNSITFEKGGKVLIGESAFEGCSLLCSVSLNDSVLSIGDAAFRDCPRIFKLKLGKEITKIGYEAFKGCERTLFDVSDNPLAAKYAAENHLSDSFVESVYFTYLQILLIILFLIILLFGYKFFKKRKKN